LASIAGIAAVISFIRCHLAKSTALFVGRDVSPSFYFIYIID